MLDSIRQNYFMKKSCHISMKGKVVTHGKTPTILPARPEYKPLKSIFPPPWVACNTSKSK